MQNQVSATPGVLTVELDFQRSADGLPPPSPLDREAAEQLGWAMAEDLQRILGDLQSYGLITLGGLYDMTELLRPGLPMVDILMDLYLRSLPDTRFQPQLMTIGTQGDHFPIQQIAPACEPGSGPLFAIPFLFVGDREAIDTLGGAMEKTMLDKGKASTKTAALITDRFGAAPVNLSYATLNDLCALLRIQLEHNDFAGLWQLLEAALFPSDRTSRVVLPEGNTFLLRDGTSLAHFPTFAEWVAGKGDLDDVVSGWAAWHRRQRQYTAGMLAHGIEVRVASGGDAATMVEGPADQAWSEAAMCAMPTDTDSLTEIVTGDPDASDIAGIAVTEHYLPTLGPVAYTIILSGPQGETRAQLNEYPLHPGAVRSIPERWRARADELAIAFTVRRPDTLNCRLSPPALLPAAEDTAVH